MFFLKNIFIHIYFIPFNAKMYLHEKLTKLQYTRLPFESSK